MSCNKLKLTSALEVRRQNWTFVIKCSRRPHNFKRTHFMSWKEREGLWNVQKWKMHVLSVQNCCFSLSNMQICDVLVAVLEGRVDSSWKYIAISKNVVGENDKCQLSNGDCTTERKCGYWILIGNKLPWYRLHTVPTFDGESWFVMWSRGQLAVRKAVSVRSLNKHGVDGSDNIIWKCHFAFLQSSCNYSKWLCLKNALQLFRD